MTRSFIAILTLLSLSSAALAQSTRPDPDANRPAPWERYHSDERAQWLPRAATPYIAPYGMNGDGAVYLNGWSSSNHPGDCNRGCVNSNGG